MAGYYGLPEKVMEVASKISPQAAPALQAYWSLLMLGVQVGGMILVMYALMELNKKYKYNQPSYGDYKIVLIVLGVIMVNMNHFIEAALNLIY